MRGRRLRSRFRRARRLQGGVVSKEAVVQGELGASGGHTGIIQNAELEGPSVDIPHPAGDGAVDEGHPEKGEDHGGQQAASLGDGAHDDGDGNGGELQLVEAEEQLGDQRRACSWVGEHALQGKVLEVPDVAAGAGRRKGQRVAPEVPLERHHGRRADAGPDEREGRLAPRQARVQEAQTGNHEQHHGRGDDDKGHVAVDEPLVHILGPCVLQLSK